MLAFRCGIWVLIAPVPVHCFSIIPITFNIDRSKAVALLWFYVACFGVRDSVTFHLKCVHIILLRFRLLSGHLLGNSCSSG